MDNESDVKMLDYSKKRRNLKKLENIYKKIENIAQLKLGFNRPKNQKMTDKKATEQKANGIV